MKRIWLVNSTEMEKEKAKRISSKQLEAKITAFTILLAVIVMNIFWWTRTQFFEGGHNHKMTKAAKTAIQTMQQK